MPDIHNIAGAVRIHPLHGVPPVHPGDDLTALLLKSIREAGLEPRSGDILVVTQKIVSKSEGQIVHLSGVTPTAQALELAEKLNKDARKVEVILQESRRVLRAERMAKTGLGVLICETHHGFVCANAGVDESNLSAPDTLLLLPADPDASAEKIRREMSGGLGVEIAVIITDSFGRPWRLGIVNVAIGIAGCPAIVDYRGKPDSGGRPLTVTEIAVADEIAAVAGMAMGKLEQIPAVLVQGLSLPAGSGRGSDLRRLAGEDLFR